MKKKLSFILALLSCCFLAAGLSACEKGNGAGSNSLSGGLPSSETSENPSSETSEPPSSEKEEASEGLEYTLSEDETYYVCTGVGDVSTRKIVIASTYEGLPVKEIGAGAFAEDEFITSIVLPDSVTKIGEVAFKHCTSIKTVDLGKGVQVIENTAFNSCSALTKVIYTGTVDDWVMIDFDNSPDANPISYAKKLYINEKEVTEVVLTSATKISAYAFYNCTSLTSVTIGNSVTTIGDYAFNGCTSLTSVTIGNGVTTIGDYAFYDCDNLTSIVIPDSVTTIGSYAFYSCDSLTSITVDTDNKNYTSIDGNLYSKDGTTLIQYAIGKKATKFIIPDSVTEIRWGAFSGCSGLTEITIPDSVTKIGDSAFSGCSGLTEITIPDSVTKIGWGAFHYCSSLTSVTFKDTNGWYRTSEEDYTGGSSMSVSDPAQNANYLRVDRSYYEYYYKK